MANRTYPLATVRVVAVNLDRIAGQMANTSVSPEALSSELRELAATLRRVSPDQDGHPLLSECPVRPALRIVAARS
jgi:hypothetical protein